MGHSLHMKAFVCLLLLFTAYARADEPADRAAIARTIDALNDCPRCADPFTDLFTGDADGRGVPEQLRREGDRYRQWPACAFEQPTITISKEPWGEYTLNYPCSVLPTQTPRIASGTVRFLTSDIALANGEATYRNGSGVIHSTPLLFVMQKVRGVWKIASMRVLAWR